MTNLKFNCANMPVEAAAKALKMDRQTVRILLQNGLVPWGAAYRKPGSGKYSYMISPIKFYEATGYFYNGGEAHG